MNKDTVTINRRALEILSNPGECSDADWETRGAKLAALVALNAKRTDEEIMRDGVAAHVRRQIGVDRVLKLTVYPREDRDSSGMLEWILQYSYESGGGITIGMIQRAPGAEVEFHS